MVYTVLILLFVHIYGYMHIQDFPAGASSKRFRLPMQETYKTKVRSLGWEDPLEEGMTSHSSILAWRIPWTEEPGGLQSPGGCKELDMTEVAEHPCTCVYIYII